MSPPASVLEQPDAQGHATDVAVEGRSTDIDGAMAIISLSRLTTRRWATYKRGSDIILSIVIIAILLIPMGGIAVLIRCTTNGPVLFRQPRRGKKGRHFNCYKFRTMYHHFSDTMAATQSRHDDSRVTPLGRWLRKSSFDELPQILNVLRGDMSLVGPRPHALGTAINGQLLPNVIEDYMLRYEVQPGITGWAQVNGCRGILDVEEKLHHRVAHDLYYIAHWTPLLDIRILLKTVTCLFGKHVF